MHHPTYTHIENPNIPTPRHPSDHFILTSHSLSDNKYFNIIETKPWCRQSHVIRKRNNFVCDFFDLPFRTVPSDFPNGKRTDCNNLLRQGSQWPRQNIAKKTSTKIDRSALVHFFQILVFLRKTSSTEFCALNPDPQFSNPAKKYSNQNWHLLRLHDDQPPSSFKSDLRFNFPPLTTGPIGAEI